MVVVFSRCAYWLEEGKLGVPLNISHISEGKIPASFEICNQGLGSTSDPRVPIEADAFSSGLSLLKPLGFVSVKV